MTLRELHEILRSIKFAPSCVDMGWQWQCRVLLEGVTVSGFLLRTTFRRPDRVTGVVSTGFGRWWHVPADVSESGVVKTAYAAARLILEHELMESFKYDGKRLFDPHHDIQDLEWACWSKETR